MSEGKKLLGLLIGLMLVGCGPAQNPTLRAEPALREPLQQAIDIWNPLIASCGRSFSIVNDSPDYTVYYGHDGTDAEGYPFPASTDTRYGSQSTLVVSHAADSSIDGLVKVITHELGHVLGAEHSPDKLDIMFAGTNGVTIPTQHDVDAVCSH